MKIDERMIRQFRSSLRQFERIIGNHNRSCCAQVTLAQCHVLLEVAAAGKTTSSALAEVLGLDVSTISRTVDSLVRMGLIARREHPVDRRSILLQVTRDGKTLSRQINRDADKYYAAVLGSIPEGQRDTVLDSFVTLTEAFVAGEGARAGSAVACVCGASGCDDGA